MSIEMKMMFMTWVMRIQAGKSSSGTFGSSSRLADYHDVGLPFERQINAARRLPRGYPGDARRIETFLFELALEIYRLLGLKRLPPHDDQLFERSRVDVEGVARDSLYLLV